MKKKIFMNRLVIVCALLVVVTLGVPSSRAHAQDLKKLATDLAMQIHALDHNRVTVVDFLDLDGKPNKLGKLLAQDLQEALADPKLKLQVVDQGHLPELFEQIKKADEGLLDPATSKALGKIAGTEVMVVGTVMPSSVTIKLQVKAIDLETAKLIKAQSASLARVGLRGALATESEGGGETDEAGDSEAGSDERGDSRAVRAKASRPPVRSRRDQGVVFELEGCSVNGDALTCDLTITSESRDRWLALSFHSRAWNDAGDEHGPDEVSIANSITDSRQRNCGTKQVLKEVPTRISMTFPQFTDEASIVERLRLVWSESDDCYADWRSVDFDKIPFSEEDDFSSPRKRGASRAEAASGGGKRSGGALQRIGGRLMGILENAAMEVIEEKTYGLVDKETLKGDEEEEEEGATPKKKKK